MAAAEAVAAIVEVVVSGRCEIRRMRLSSRVVRWRVFRLGFTRCLPTWVKMQRGGFILVVYIKVALAISSGELGAFCSGNMPPCESDESDGELQGC